MAAAEARWCRDLSGTLKPFSVNEKPADRFKKRKHFYDKYFSKRAIGTTKDD